MILEKRSESAKTASIGQFGHNFGHLESQKKYDKDVAIKIFNLFKAYVPNLFNPGQIVW